MTVAAPSPGRGAKAPDAYRTISEVADELDVPQHVLRFWETRFPQIKPLKRGGGRRYYRREDVDLVRGIRALLYGQGYTIKGVQRILREGGVRFVQAVGRGEAVAAAPVVRDAGATTEAADGPDLERDPSGLDVPGRDILDREALDHDTLDRDALNREALAGALQDLYACRAALAAFRAPPEA